MDILKRIRHVACRLDVDRFVMAHGGLYLLGSFPRPDDDSPDESWSFTTQPGIRVAEVKARSAEERERALLAGRFLFKVEKSGRNPWRGRISVGRAPNNDLVIRHPSISKLHAHFLLDHAAEPGDAPMSLRLGDVGSRNGTAINGTRLEPDVPRPTAPGDSIFFGEVACHLLDAGTLHARIRAQLPVTS